MSHEQFRFPAYRLLEFVFVLIVVEAFFHQIQLDGIEANNFQLHSALFTIDGLALVCISIDVNFGFTFGTRSGGHYSLPPMSFRIAWVNLMGALVFCK